MAKRRRRSSGARKLLIVVLLAVSAVALILYLTKGGGKIENEYLGQIQINEVMTSNKGSVPDETGDFPDWIEVYNNTDNALDISGFGLADELISAAKWTFPEGSVVITSYSIHYTKLYDFDGDARPPRKNAISGAHRVGSAAAAQSRRLSHPRDPRVS